MIPSLVEIALRALLVAAAVWAGLRLLRVRDVLAQKTAWVLVLAAAFLLPLLLPLALRWQILPAGFTLSLPAHPWRAALQAPARDASRLRAAQDEWPTKTEAPGLAPAPARPAAISAAPPAVFYGSTSPRSIIQTPPPLDRSLRRAPQLLLLPTLQSLALCVYLAVCAALLVRLLYGLSSAIGMWVDAEPVELQEAAGLRLRSSRAVSSPVTIGSGVLLPAGYSNWEREKLRIVLAHERSHIRQADFYLQLLAGVYAALFWFSPLGWWLKRKLSDLGEAISDRAGLEQAASRSSYAQLLLEFAAAPRPALMGVAMARSSSLSHRIERLLNDSSFRQAFTVSRRRALLAFLLVPAALFAATSLVRVQAAGQDASAASPAPVQAPAAALAPRTGQSNPPEAIEPAASVEPPAAMAPIAPLSPPAPRAGLAPAAPVIAPMSPQQSPPAQPAPPPNITVGRGESMTISNSRAHGYSYSRSGRGEGYAYSFHSGDEDSYALVTSPSGGVRWSGDWNDGRRRDIEKAAQVAHGGKFLWFEHEGKSYVIDDPSIIAGIEAMYQPIDELGRQQEELGKRQEELGRQQEELGRRQEQVTAPAPDVTAEIAKIEAALAKLKARQGTNVTQEDLSDIQEKMGDLQSKLGDIEGKLGEEQGKLGEQQGKLGEQQGKLGEEQGRLAQQADSKVREIIDQSLTNGKARPVE